MSYKENNFVQLLLSTVYIVLSSFVTMVGWNWYIHPFGVTSIGFVWAFGIRLFINSFTYKEVLFHLHQERMGKNGFDVIINNISYSLTLLLFLYLFHLFM